MHLEIEIIYLTTEIIYLTIDIIYLEAAYECQEPPCLHAFRDR